jgi:hypothetical protein
MKHDQISTNLAQEMSAFNNYGNQNQIFNPFFGFRLVASSRLYRISSASLSDALESVDISRALVSFPLPLPEKSHNRIRQIFNDKYRILRNSDPRRNINSE